MTTFVKIVDGVVVQKQAYTEDGFIEAPDNVVCGMVQVGNAFQNPPPPPPPDYPVLDQAALNAMLAQEGSVVRALALVLLQEINTLRVKATLTPYTQAQLVTALKAKMR